MTIDVRRTLTVTTADGVKSTFPDDAKVETDTNVTITCAGPRCGIHHGSSEPATIKFNEEQVKVDVNALPDSYARIMKLTIKPYAPQELPFCSVRCIKDFLDYEYVESRSPRELAVMAKQERDAQRELFPDPPVNAVTGKVDVLNPPGPKYL